MYPNQNILGNGPSALFLSFLLHGNVPYYDPDTKYGPHPDRELHRLLQPYVYESGSALSLLDAMKDHRILSYIQFSYASFFSANTSPTSLLFDALIASEEASFASFESKETRIKWIHDTTFAIPHIILGSSPKPGGQWSSGNTSDDTEEKSLSYAEMLSLPGFSFTEFFCSHEKKESSNGMKSFTRPKRGDIANYYDEYSKRMCASYSRFLSNTVVTNVDLIDLATPTYMIFYIDKITGNTYTHTTNAVVLASGVFEKPLRTLLDQKLPSVTTPVLTTLSLPIIGQTRIPIIPPPKNFNDIGSMEPSVIVPTCQPHLAHQTVLIIGTGVSAAETVNRYSKYPNIHIIHMYRWSLEHPGPLRRFSKETYPEYARIYRLMKRACKQNLETTTVHPDFFSDGSDYECMPNSCILEMSSCGKVSIKLGTGEIVNRSVSSIELCTGRSGSLMYLSPTICKLAGFLVHDNGSATASSNEVDLNAVNKMSLKPYLVSSKPQSVKEEGSEIVATSSNLATVADNQAREPESTTTSRRNSCFSDEGDFINTPSPSLASSMHEDSDGEYSLRLGNGLYTIGSLTGESLVRLMLGGCAWVAGDIFKNFHNTY
jgi:hypothetical protein